MATSVQLLVTAIALFASQGIGICSGAYDIPYIQNMRLMSNGRVSSREGVVQVWLENNWRTICHDHWDNADAEVVCRHLGLGTTRPTAVRNAQKQYGTASLIVAFNNVDCMGNERRLDECKFRDVMCTPYSQAAGVQCPRSLGPDLPTPDNDDYNIDVMLLGNTAEGIAVVHGGTRGTSSGWSWICEDSFSATDSHVFCKQLGYESGERIDYEKLGQQDVDNVPFWPGDVACMGDEEELSQCFYAVYENEEEGAGRRRARCESGRPTALRCSDVPPTPPPMYSHTGKVNLLALDDSDISESSAAGVLMVLHGGQWGTVCNHHFDDADATVACKDLNYANGRADYDIDWSKYPQQMDKKIWLSELRCQGDEPHIFSCLHSGLGSIRDCTHSDDVVVHCYN